MSAKHGGHADEPNLSEQGTTIVGQRCPVSTGGGGGGIPIIRPLLVSPFATQNRMKTATDEQCVCYETVWFREPLRWGGTGWTDNIGNVLDQGEWGKYKSEGRRNHWDVASDSGKRFLLSGTQPALQYRKKIRTSAKREMLAQAVMCTKTIVKEHIGSGEKNNRIRRSECPSRSGL